LRWLLSGGALELTAIGAPVTADAVSVITGFAAILDAIATACE